MAHLIFDLDGTLLDVRARHYAVYEASLGELGIRPLDERSYWSRRRAGEGTLSLVGGLPGPLRQRFTQMWMDRIEDAAWLAMDSLYDGAAEVCAALKGHHGVLVTLRRDRPALLAQLDALGLNAHFSAVISPAGSALPARKTALLPARLPGETWVIGDSEADLLLASDLGAQAICVTHGVRGADYLRAAGARMVLQDLHGVARLLAGAALVA